MSCRNRCDEKARTTGRKSEPTNGQASKTANNRKGKHVGRERRAVRRFVRSSVGRSVGLPFSKLLACCLLCRLRSLAGPSITTHTIIIIRTRPANQLNRPSNPANEIIRMIARPYSKSVVGPIQKPALVSAAHGTSPRTLTDAQWSRVDVREVCALPIRVFSDGSWCVFALVRFASCSGLFRFAMAC